ncbi:MAG: dienelactone hydrolase family protein, partial [Deltaproteobacteria bacterium]|nr:dienelactone hydrolase family protein [Deltaproteobacteria bacterium]
NTNEGEMPTFIVHPEEGGPHPVVILYMDAPGIREELRDFARRVASVGYYTLLPNLFYRDGGPSFPPADRRTPEQTRQMNVLLEGLTNARLISDTRTLLMQIDGDPAARKGPLGCIGYCMSGRYVLTMAGTFPERFQACVAMHGVRMATPHPDSPHKLIPKLRGEHYWGFAEVDEHVPQAEVDLLKQAVAAAKAPVRIEIHPGTGHGFVFPDRKPFHKAQAERYWEHSFALFRRILG